MAAVAEYEAMRENRKTNREQKGMVGRNILVINGRLVLQNY